MGEIINTNTAIETQPGGDTGALLDITQSLLADARTALNSSGVLSVPIAELSTLGAGVSSLIPALNTVTQTTSIAADGLYTIANAGVGDVLKAAKNGNFWASLKTADGASKMVQLQEAGAITATTQTAAAFNPATMMMAVALFSIEQELGEIEDITAMLRENMKSTNVEETIDRFWDMFIVDALIGNFDRHGGNWGFIKRNNQYRIAPVYDNGSSLYPKLNTDEKLEAVLSSEEEIDQRIYKFPTSHIKVKNRKSSYFEVISSLQFEACNDALKRIVPRIDFNQINTLIDEVEGISEVRKRFYKVMLQQRYEKILMYAYRQL